MLVAGLQPYLPIFNVCFLCVCLCTHGVAKNTQPLTTTCKTTRYLISQPGKKSSVNRAQIKYVWTVSLIGFQHVWLALNISGCSGSLHLCGDLLALLILSPQCPLNPTPNLSSSKHSEQPAEPERGNEGIRLTMCVPNPPSQPIRLLACLRRFSDEQVHMIWTCFLKEM